MEEVLERNTDEAPMKTKIAFDTDKRGGVVVGRRQNASLSEERANQVWELFIGNDSPVRNLERYTGTFPVVTGFSSSPISEESYNHYVQGG
jgi:hypothetical protein